MLEKNPTSLQILGKHLPLARLNNSALISSVIVFQPYKIIYNKYRAIRMKSLKTSKFWKLKFLNNFILHTSISS